MRLILYRLDDFVCFAVEIKLSLLLILNVHISDFASILYCSDVRKQNSTDAHRNVFFVHFLDSERKHCNKWLGTCTRHYSKTNEKRKLKKRNDRFVWTREYIPYEEVIAMGSKIVIYDSCELGFRMYSISRKAPECVLYVMSVGCSLRRGSNWWCRVKLMQLDEGRKKALSIYFLSLN